MGSTRYWGHQYSHTHAHTLTDTYTPELAQPYVCIYGDTHTHPHLSIGWLRLPPSSILNRQARQPLAEGPGNPPNPGSWGLGAGPGGGSGQAVGEQGHLFSMHIS